MDFIKVRNQLFDLFNKEPSNVKFVLPKSMREDMFDIVYQFKDIYVSKISFLTNKRFKEKIIELENELDIIITITDKAEAYINSVDRV